MTDLSVLEQAREMALLASIEAGTPEDCADAALRVVLEHLLSEDVAMWFDTTADPERAVLADDIEALLKGLDRA